MIGGVADDIKRGSARRNAKLASIPVGMAGRAALGAAKRLTGKSRDEVNAELMDKAANQLFSVLGELKGGAMKVGQALSVLEAAIPEEFGEPYREALTKLQKDAPPLSADKVHRVLDGQLGTKWRDRFASFDDTPVASASIGQVHKGVWADGREVAVKIQYPADEALRADLKTMRRLTSVLKQLSPGADVQGVVDELVERTEMELDYRLEANNQRAFAKAYQGHPHFFVPRIVGSAPKVMVSEWINGGIPLAEIIRSGTPEQRDICGTRLFELTFDAPARVGMMHGDAHPGNFMLLPDGRMAVIDFGAVAPLPDGLPVEMGIMIRLAQEKQYDLLLPTMEKVGFVRKGEQVSLEAIDEMLAQYVEPVQVPVFHYTRKWLQKHAAANMERTPQNLKMARQMDLPAQLAIPLRVIGSTVAISCQLDCHVPVREMAEKLIPGYAEPHPVV
jgi:predicted unusual protein kinase regulating ubiquinone biosynthesis (AarF/ABC1/UbiB family)